MRGGKPTAHSAVALLLILGGTMHLPGQDMTSAAAADAVTLVNYRTKLQDLKSLTAQCAKARDTAHCDPNLIGTDTRVPLGEGPKTPTRTIRYDWLRLVFVRAKQNDREAETLQLGPAAKGLSAADLLRAAQERLDQDIAQSTLPGMAPSKHDAERTILKQVLAGSEFKNLKRESARDSWLEKFARWLNHLFEGVGRFRTHSAWVGRALVWGFLLSIVIGLAWALLQMERRWRVRLVPDADSPAPDAPSARDWQLWMADARAAAERGAWREAIHNLYWASISRMESKRLWPTDRTRTPRECLALLGRDDSRYARFRALTLLFERTWYGGREAAEPDFRVAEEIASELIAGRHAHTVSNARLTEGGAL